MENKKKLNRTNLYKNINLAIASNISLATLSSFTSLVLLSATGAAEYSVISKFVENPNFIAAIPICLGTLALGGSATYLSTKTTLDILKLTRNMINEKKELENQEHLDDKDLVLKYNNIQKYSIYSK